MTGNVSEEPADLASWRMPCAFCQEPAALWIHHLDWDRARYRIYGKGHVWAGQVTLCDRCERLYDAGDDEGIVDRYERTWERNEHDVTESIRHGLAAFRNADLGVESIAAWVPPGAAVAAGEGFVPLEMLTGDEELVEQWPHQHRRAVPETRYANDDDLDAPEWFWLLRSPWPGLAMHDVIDALSRFVEERMPQPPMTAGRVLPDYWAARRAFNEEFLRLDQRSVAEQIDIIHDEDEEGRRRDR